MHRRELGGSIDDIRYLESHAAADDAFRLIIAMLRALLGPLLRSTGRWTTVFHRKVISLQRPLLKIDAKTS
jgi:hypothetical protein